MRHGNIESSNDLNKLRIQDELEFVQQKLKIAIRKNNETKIKKYKDKCEY